VFDRVTVIAFDLDDTLWPCMPTIHRAEETLYRWLERHFPRITEGHGPDELVALRREFTAREARYSVDMTAMRRDFLRHIGDRYDYDGELVSRRGFEVFFHARQQVELYEDVLPALRRLKTRFRLGAISNGNASVDHVGLGHLIEHAVSAADLQVAKPDAQIYRHLARHFAASPAEILYVGDHPEYDVVGATEAGFQAVWVNREQTPWPEHLPAPGHEVADLWQLEALLSD